MKRKVYGDHVMVVRGTSTEAKINDVLQVNANQSGKAGALGSPVLKQLKVIEKGFVAVINFTDVVIFSLLQHTVYLTPVLKQC